MTLFPLQIDVHPTVDNMDKGKSVLDWLPYPFLPQWKYGIHYSRSIIDARYHVAQERRRSAAEQAGYCTEGTNVIDRLRGGLLYLYRPHSPSSI